MNPASACGSITVYQPPISVSCSVKFLPCGHPAKCARSANLGYDKNGDDAFIPHGCQWCDDLAERDGRIADLESKLLRQQDTTARP